ncbi:hypothetical protein C9374_002760 [Naegleria lovaniensis]|uniref:Protein kinase domain-containing protein n=1 Tax=Naegleria lovaniensis TaxID=51637 RepID=A0AA88GV61_NAELO|nr:uncharacterized protein C9374_002760 [Naegleria lovaniensis]KAG2386314.1 hypothetical protein C9374_002760 [Naegleria lovaniensis]
MASSCGRREILFNKNHHLTFSVIIISSCILLSFLFFSLHSIQTRHFPHHDDDFSQMMVHHVVRAESSSLSEIMSTMSIENHENDTLHLYIDSVNGSDLNQNDCSLKDRPCQSIQAILEKNRALERNILPIVQLNVLSSLLEIPSWINGTYYLPIKKTFRIVGMGIRNTTLYQDVSFQKLDLQLSLLSAMRVKDEMLVVEFSEMTIKTLKLGNMPAVTIFNCLYDTIYLRNVTIINMEFCESIVTPINESKKPSNGSTLLLNMYTKLSFSNIRLNPQSTVFGNVDKSSITNLGLIKATESMIYFFHVIVSNPEENNTLVAYNIAMDNCLLHITDFNQIIIGNAIFTGNLYASRYMQYLSFLQSDEELLQNRPIEILAKDLIFSQSSVNIVAQARASAGLVNCIFTQAKQTGALHLEGVGLLTSITNSQFLDNESARGGAAIMMRSVYFTYVQNCTFAHNRQTSPNFNIGLQTTGGGAIHQYQSVFSSSFCTYVNNTAKTYGGVLYSYLGNRVWLIGDKFHENMAAIGGAIYTKNTMSVLPFILEDCEFRNNFAEKFGGALFSIRAAMQISSFASKLPVISQNTARVTGGGLYQCESTVNWYETRVNEFTQRTEKVLISSESSVQAQALIPQFIKGNTVLTPFHLPDKTSFPGEAFLKLLVKRPQRTRSTSSQTNHDQHQLIPLLGTNSSDPNVYFTTYFGEELTFELWLKDTFGQNIPYDGTLMLIDTVDDEIVYSEVRSNIFEKDEEGKLPLFHPDVKLLSYSYHDPFPQNATVKFSLTFLQDSVVTFYFHVHFVFESCPTMHSSASKTHAMGKKVYYCEFNVAYLSPLIIVIGLVVLITVIVITVFSVRKLKKMKFSVKLLKQKEKAEIELTQKLLDLQTLYASELEHRHSFKDWLIKLEDIEIISKIGEGGQGVVYKARWRNADVALKSIKIDDSDLDSNEFENEASLLSSIRHPNVVTFFGVCLTESNKFMVTEFMHGGSLDSLIYQCKLKKKFIPLADKIHMLSDIASGMSYLHHGRDKMIIHRDLKPGNILLSNDLTCKVCDFGMSKLYQQESDRTKTCRVGTLLYMAPEVLLGEYYNETADVYSFALIMWQLCFDESTLFSSSFSKDAKFTSFMSSEQISQYSSLNDSIVVLPKLVTDGLRLPIPSLPLDASSNTLRTWIDEFFLRNSNGIVSPKSYDTHISVLNDFFNLLVQCWSKDISERPSFSLIFNDLCKMEKNLRSTY